MRIWNSTVNPEDPGMFYQWNRKAGWSSKDPKINSNNETYWNMNDESGSIWSVAANPCPVGWRVPTSDELSSLEGAGTWTTNWKGTGVNGVVFGSGNNTVFLPAASSRDFSGRLSSDQVGTNGRYWSSTPHTFNNSRAYYLSFRSGEIDAGFDAYRSSGFCVRCVLAEE